MGDENCLKRACLEKDEWRRQVQAYGYSEATENGACSMIVAL